MKKKGINEEMRQSYLQEYFINDNSFDSPISRKRNSKIY